jgi:hypothetical protein
MAPEKAIQIMAAIVALAPFPGAETAEAGISESSPGRAGGRAAMPSDMLDIA